MEVASSVLPLKQGELVDPITAEWRFGYGEGEWVYLAKPLQEKNDENGTTPKNIGGSRDCRLLNPPPSTTKTTKDQGI